MDNFAFLSELNSKQREVCCSPDNYLLTACPGSGKTRTITYRLAYLCHKNPDSRRLNIAITYTNRAAEEIEHRLSSMGIDLSSVWTGTIHQFCMHFIIRPYSLYSERLRKGYTIIDEYVTEQRYREATSIVGKKYNQYESPDDPEVRKAYHALLLRNKEIDFDLILELALDMVQKCPFICENIAGMIRSIHVDEYQDTKESQYQILAAIIRANRAINLLFVGDVNQLIYRSLGSVAKSADEIRQLYPLHFEEKVLDGCYRSSQRIIDFYSNFEVQKTGATAVSDGKDAHGIIAYDRTTDCDQLTVKIAEIISTQLAQGIPEHEICVAAPQWHLLYPVSNELQKLLPNVKFDAPDITPFKYDKMNPFYLLAQLTFTSASSRATYRKRAAREFLEILRGDYGVPIGERADVYGVLKAVNNAVDSKKDGMVCLQCVVKNVFRYLNISLAQEDRLNDTYTAFLAKANKRIADHRLPTMYSDLVNAFQEKDGVKISTIHGLKGEEYHTVIAYGLLKGYVPSWNAIYDQNVPEHQEAMKLLYVLCSRARRNLFLFSETGRKTQKGYAYTPSTELRYLTFDFD